MLAAEFARELRELMEQQRKKKNAADQQQQQSNGDDKFVWMIACELLTELERRTFGFLRKADETVSRETVGKSEFYYTVVMRRRGFESEAACRANLRRFVEDTKRHWEDWRKRGENVAGCTEELRDIRLRECLVDGTRRYIEVVDRDPYGPERWSDGGYVWYHLMVEEEHRDAAEQQQQFSIFSFSETPYDDVEECYAASPDPDLCEYCSRPYDKNGRSVVAFDVMNEQEIAAATPMEKSAAVVDRP